MIKGVSSITPGYVEKLIDFAPTKAIADSGIGELQLAGTVALFNMLARNGVAYLADEVGMGKTYIALAVMSLLRYQKPDARILIITPRRNIQEKWEGDLTSFVQHNWRCADHRVKTPLGDPVWPVALPDSLYEWIIGAYASRGIQDTILRMSSFSYGVEDKQIPANLRQRITYSANRLVTDTTHAQQIHPCPPEFIEQLCEAYDSKDQRVFSRKLAMLLSQAVQYDLIIVDEAHNLKYGYRPGKDASNRNLTMHHMLGVHPDADVKNAANANAPLRPWLLMMSATPVENGDMGSLVRQFEVFGRQTDILCGPELSHTPQQSLDGTGGSVPEQKFTAPRSGISISIEQLAMLNANSAGRPESDVDDASAREENTVSDQWAHSSDQERATGNTQSLHDWLRWLMVRRVGKLKLPGSGQEYTRNMYRREWRHGGVISPHEPMTPATLRDRLVNAVFQKQILNEIQAKRHGRFRIGELESFEVYSGAPSELADPEARQKDENRPADQHVIAKLSDSFRATFQTEVPHPKLDAVAEFLAQQVQQRQKALVFVRRIATTEDLSARVAESFDRSLLQRLRDSVSSQQMSIVDEIERTWRAIRVHKSKGTVPIRKGAEKGGRGHDGSTPLEESEHRRSFFNWYFKGASSELKLQHDRAGSDLHGQKAPTQSLFSGRHFRERLDAKNRLCLILEENYVDWFLGRPDDILGQLAGGGQAVHQDKVRDVLNGIADTLNGLGLIRGKENNINHRRRFQAVQYGTLLWILAGESGISLDDLQRQKLSVLIDEVFDFPAGQGRSDRNTHQFQADEVRALLCVRGLYPVLARSDCPEPVRQIVARGVFSDVNEKVSQDWRLLIRKREQIRHMQMALLRHGAPMLDLYFAALASYDGKLMPVTDHGSVTQGFPAVPVASPGDNERGVTANRELSTVERISAALVQYWSECCMAPAQWRASGGWELAEVCENFELIRKLNFPHLDRVKERTRPLDDVFAIEEDGSQGMEGSEGVEGSEGAREAKRDGSDRYSVRKLLSQELQYQSPCVAAMGDQDDHRRRRITSHFRMPGMPWVVVATNVFQEGVDLHTYCRTVIHHGVTHAASSIEQRTGRVDRIGGLLQREVGQQTFHSGLPDELKIQSLFPYQNDTFEKHQVRRVLQNCNRFIEALHHVDEVVEHSPEMALEEKYVVPKQITNQLRSPFDVSSSAWLVGELNALNTQQGFDQLQYEAEVGRFEQKLKESLVHRGLALEATPGQGLARNYRIVGHSNRVDAQGVTPHRKIGLTPGSDCLTDRLMVEVEVEMDSDAAKLKFQVPCEHHSSNWCDDVSRRVIDAI